jgi:hypothetical protein
MGNTGVNLFIQPIVRIDVVLLDITLQQNRPVVFGGASAN